MQASLILPLELQMNEFSLKHVDIVVLKSYMIVSDVHSAMRCDATIMPGDADRTSPSCKIQRSDRLSFSSNVSW